MNIIEGLQQACRESREHIVELEETAKLFGHESADDDPGLRISKALSQAMIDAAESAIASGDVVAMVQAAHMRNWKAMTKKESRITDSDRECTVGQARAALEEARRRGLDGWSRTNPGLTHLQAWGVFWAVVQYRAVEELLDRKHRGRGAGLMALNLRREFGVDGKLPGLKEPKKYRRRRPAPVWPILALALAFLIAAPALADDLPPQCEGIVGFSPADAGCSGSDSVYGFSESVAAEAPLLVCIASPGYEYLLAHSCLCEAYQGAGYLEMAGLPVPDVSVCWALIGSRPATCQRMVACGTLADPLIFADGFESGNTWSWS